MPEPRPATLNGASPETPPALPGAKPGVEAYALLRKLGGTAYQLHAAVRAADHFLAAEQAQDRDIGSWLISSAFELAEELVADLDGLAKQMKEKTSDSAILQALRRLRVRAHQLHAATRAADHFLEQESSEDRSTGSWLIAYALGLADKLAGELEDAANGLKRSAGEAGDVATPDAPDFSGLNAARRTAMIAVRESAA